MFRRETIIALRARREAYQVASKVAHPNMPRPVRPLAGDALPDEPPPMDPEVVETYHVLSLVSLAVAGVVIFVFVWAIAMWPRY
jgi:hypothetical protein